MVKATLTLVHEADLVGLLKSFNQWWGWWTQSKNWNNLTKEMQYESKRVAWSAWKEAWNESKAQSDVIN